MNTLTKIALAGSLFLSSCNTIETSDYDEWKKLNRTWYFRPFTRVIYSPKILKLDNETIYKLVTEDIENFEKTRKTSSVKLLDSKLNENSAK